MSAQRPFPGLRPFDFRDREFFFGRQEQIYSLYRLIDRSRFVAVVGSSGSGKSSLVRAGLLPLLDEETGEPGGRNWQRRVMHPGEAPIARLAKALASLALDDDPAIAAVRHERISFDLHRSSFGVADALGKIESFIGFSLLLVVDQFEELFRYARGEAAGVPDALEGTRYRDEAAQFVQLLLEAGRSPACDIHIIVTMRSDFIGDCARFHGLPEAVSATQFLVPSLTRDQMEEVIRKPLEKVGDTIEPALVERLLNDSSDELDQLPVLQHCLLRLWERAGAESGGIGADKISPEKSTGEAAAGLRGRHLTPDHYFSIGRISGALSQHAEEVFSELSGLELAVEQAFRALAEIDREGRAIRRALPFSQLLEETGIREKDLRRVLDRFRADDCSFLVPSLSDAPSIEANMRIDVGHEALLRRWERASRWLRDEAADGQRYRGLLSLLDEEGAGVPTLPLGLVDERWSWWKARPRTAAWAARYGGGLDRVQRLLDASRAALGAEEARKQREEKDAQLRAALQARVARITRIAAAAMAVLVVLLLAIVGLVYHSYQQAKTNEQHYLEVLLGTTSLANQITDYQDIGAISSVLAQEFLETLSSTSTELLKVAQTPEAKKVGLTFQLDYCDAWYKLGNYEKALDIAKDANQLANDLAASDPTKAEWQWLIYESLFRIGDALDGQRKPDEALHTFHQAQEIAERLTARDPQAGMPKLIFIDNKIAETLHEQGKILEALAGFETALSTANKLIAKDPTNFASRRTLATTLTKIGKLLLSEKPPDIAGAVGRFNAALDILKKLADEQPDNETALSNLATVYGLKAKALSEVDRDAAIAGYQSAIAIRKPLVDKHPNNIFGLVYLARDYERLGSTLPREDVNGAIDAYQNAIKIRQTLIDKDPKNEAWQNSLKKDEAMLEQLQRLPQSSGESVKSGP